VGKEMNAIKRGTNKIEEVAKCLGTKRNEIIGCPKIYTEILNIA
jgi:hypothetical protein